MAKIYTRATPVTTTVNQAAPQPSGSFDLDKALSRVEECLNREIYNLLSATASGKLSPTDTNALISYVKLLREMQAEQAEALSRLSDEALEAVATQAKKDSEVP